MQQLAMMAKYDNIKALIDTELGPLIDAWVKTATIANSFSNAAEHIAHVNVADTHEINELLDQCYEARKLGERLQKVIDRRSSVVLDMIRGGSFEFKGVVSNKK